eukprot:GHVT01025650.1.p4 GENE.GHVT01025650.1~~GHVT01025650.1.p4  ORF type:complete len:100 (-),score=7.07 GHVT01025650.1:830-1129(-)
MLTCRWERSKCATINSPVDVTANAVGPTPPESWRKTLHWNTPGESSTNRRIRFIPVSATYTSVPTQAHGATAADAIKKQNRHTNKLKIFKFRPAAFKHA